MEALIHQTQRKLSAIERNNPNYSSEILAPHIHSAVDEVIPGERSCVSLCIDPASITDHHKFWVDCLSYHLAINTISTVYVYCDHYNIHKILNTVPGPQRKKLSLTSDIKNIRTSGVIISNDPYYNSLIASQDAFSLAIHHHDKCSYNYSHPHHYVLKTMRTQELKIGIITDYYNVLLGRDCDESLNPVPHEQSITADSILNYCVDVYLFFHITDKDYCLPAPRPSFENLSSIKKQLLTEIHAIQKVMSSSAILRFDYNVNQLHPLCEFSYVAKCLHAYFNPMSLKTDIEEFILGLQAIHELLQGYLSQCIHDTVMEC